MGLKGGSRFSDKPLLKPHRVEGIGYFQEAEKLLLWHDVAVRLAAFCGSVVSKPGTFDVSKLVR